MDTQKSSIRLLFNRVASKQTHGKIINVTLKRTLAVEPRCRLTCNFSKFLDNLLFCFALGDGANKQPVVGHGDAHTDGFPWSNFTVVALRKRREAQVRRGVGWGGGSRGQRCRHLRILPAFEKNKNKKFSRASFNHPTSLTACWAASLVQKVTKA